MKKIFFISILMLLGIMVNTICAQSLKKLYFTTEQNSEKKRSVNETSYLQSKLNLSEKFTLQTKRNSTKEILAEITDSLGYTHRRYEQYYNGIKIEHSDIRVHIFNGNLVSANGEYASFEYLDTSVIITTAEALNLAKDFVRSLINDTSNNYSLNSYYNPEIVICNNRTDINDTLFHVAYKIDIYSDKHPFHECIYINAKNGKILNHLSLANNINATAATRYSGIQNISTIQIENYYVLVDTTRGNGIKTYNLNNSRNLANAVYFTDNDNNWSADEFNNDQKDNGALDAHWGAMMVYDYFKEIHGRNSFDDNDAEIISYVHYGNINNAQWDAPNNCILYGDNNPNGEDMPTSLDAVAHEIGHGICRHSADILLRDEYGAIHESLSDIWAACVEEWATSGWTESNKNKWLIGEEQGNPLRSMANPSLYNHSDTYRGNYWVYSDDATGIYINCGVMNHWFYLLTEGGNGTNDFLESYSVSGIGILKASKIVYRAETVYMTENTSFNDARLHTIRAAKDLYGENSNEVASVEDAWYAVGVGIDRNIDLYMRDNVSDNGTEPNNVINIKDSPDIWVRRNADGGTVHQLPRQGAENYVYVRIHNRGTSASLGNDVVKLYIKTGGFNTNSWSSGWTMIGSTSIPQIASGSSVIVRIDATFPYKIYPSSNFPYIGYAMLTRIESEFDGLYIAETPNTKDNVLNNNNISFDNVINSDVVLLDDVVTDVVVAALENSTDGLFHTSLTFSSPANEEGNPLFEEAEIRLVFPKTLVQSWGSDYSLSGAKKINDSTFLVTGSTVKMVNISIPANYNGYMMAQVNFLTQEYSEKDKYEYIVEQTDPTTGEYQNGLVMIVDKTLRSNLFMAEGGENIVANANTSVNLSATAIGEDAVYNWYDASGVLVNSGQNIAVTSSQTQKYTLEVTAKADGYKDYDSVYVIRTLGNIVGISPNPTSGHAVVTYNLTSGVSAASIVVTNSSGLAVYSSAINVLATTHTLNVQNLVAGRYSVRLVSATGEVLDSKTLIVQ